MIEGEELAEVLASLRKGDVVQVLGEEIPAL